MSEQEYQKLLKQFPELEAKLHAINQKLDVLFQDLDINHGAKVCAKLDEIIINQKKILNDIETTQSGTLKYQIDNVNRSMEFITERLGK